MFSNKSREFRIFIKGETGELTVEPEGHYHEFGMGTELVHVIEKSALTVLEQENKLLEVQLDRSERLAGKLLSDAKAYHDKCEKLAAALLNISVAEYSDGIAGVFGQIAASALAEYGEWKKK